MNCSYTHTTIQNAESAFFGLKETFILFSKDASTAKMIGKTWTLQKIYISK